MAEGPKCHHRRPLRPFDALVCAVLGGLQGSRNLPAMLTVRVDTLPAGLVPQFDSFVITGGYDEPPIRGEPEPGGQESHHQSIDITGATHRLPVTLLELPSTGTRWGHTPCSDPK